MTTLNALVPTPLSKGASPPPCPEAHGWVPCAPGYISDILGRKKAIMIGAVIW